ncbi:LysR family transcriptional regulator [Vibrio profundi]|uniref:LysR family transcriptional regulator n=1 Tax=Vibrio profundi TaxID=1774960 RepID=UPI003734F678
MDKLTHYKSYTAIVEKGSLKKTADHLNLSASTVSKHLTALEQYYNVNLVIRSPHHIRITPEGKLFYENSKAVMNFFVNAERQFQTPSTGTRTIRITISQVLSQGYFLSGLSAFSTAHPHIKLDVIVSNSNLDLTKGDIDFAFRGGPLADSQMHAIQLFKSKTLLCTAQRNQLNQEQLRDAISEHLLIPSYVNLSTLRSYLKSINITKPIDHFCAFDDAFSYKNAVLSGMGYGIFLDFFVEQELKDGVLSKVPAPFQFDYRDIDINMLYYNNVQLSEEQSIFKSFISNYYKQPM